jgi:hypothetical protein
LKIIVCTFENGDVQKWKKEMKIIVVLLNVDVLLQVKVVRETMNRSLDMWKEVKDISENVHTPVKSACASVGEAYYV